MNHRLSGGKHANEKDGDEDHGDGDVDGEDGDEDHDGGDVGGEDDDEFWKIIICWASNG